MATQPAWLLVLEVVAKVAALALLYGFLLRRAGLRYRAVVLVIVGHGMLLFCLVPLSIPMAGLAVLSSGTCCYAVLAIAPPWARAAVVGSVHAAVFLVLLRDEPRPLALCGVVPLAMLTGMMVVIRDWARGDPGSR